MRFGGGNSRRFGHRAVTCPGGGGVNASVCFRVQSSSWHCCFRSLYHAGARSCPADQILLFHHAAAGAVAGRPSAVRAALDAGCDQAEAALGEVEAALDDELAMLMEQLQARVALLIGLLHRRLHGLLHGLLNGTLNGIFNGVCNAGSRRTLLTASTI